MARLFDFGAIWQRCSRRVRRATALLLPKAMVVEDGARGAPYYRDHAHLVHTEASRQALSGRCEVSGSKRPSTGVA